MLSLGISSSRVFSYLRFARINMDISLSDLVRICVIPNQALNVPRKYIFHVLCQQLSGMIHRLSTKSSPDYKHLLQENYVEYKRIFF